MDGFHRTAAFLAAHTAVRGGQVVPMWRVKGSPETFDAEGLAAAVAALREGPVRWPVYDRRLHDVAEGALFAGNVALIEGNWLLLDEPGFAGLRALSDYSVAIYADEALLKDRLIARKRAAAVPTRPMPRRTTSSATARTSCATPPAPDAADLNLRMTGDGAYEVI